MVCLAKAHAHETVLSTNLARDQERQRLMRDLHDGLSGHIVSIIALAESAEEQDIERAAREALDDLRLVIQSLDIGDEDIPVVLAYFRERTALQLRRLGIALEWSMDRLPAITGVTPGHALTLLRILQEAVTNAIKHGPARSISVTGNTYKTVLPASPSKMTVAMTHRRTAAMAWAICANALHRSAERLPSRQCRAVCA